MKKTIYELSCPICKTTFEVPEKKVGKEPFDVACPDCGEDVGSEFIINTYEEMKKSKSKSKVKKVI